MTPLEGLGYAVDPLDRASALREDAAAVAALARAPRRARSSSSRATCRSCGKAAAGLEPLLPLAEVEALGGARVEALLGLPARRRAGVRGAARRRGGRRAVGRERRLSRPARARRSRPRRPEMVDLRSLAAGGLVPAPEASMLATAKSLLAWHARRSFCSNCGARTDGRRGRLAARMPGLRHAALSPHRPGRHHAGDRRRRLPARAPAAVPEGHVFGARRLSRARRDDRAGGPARDHGGGRDRLRRGPLLRLAAVAVPLVADDRLLRRGREPDDHGRHRSNSRTPAGSRATRSRAMLEKRHPDGLAAPIPMAIAHHSRSSGSGEAGRRTRTRFLTRELSRVAAATGAAA